MATRSSNRRLLRSAGFSLVEVIAVLALFGLIAGVLVSSGDAMLRAISSEDVEQVALRAVAEARHQAVLIGTPMDLRYDEPARQLNWGGGQATLAGEDGLRLLPPVRTSSVLIGGKLVEDKLERVRFYPDGTCDPFRLEIIRDRVSQYVMIDPWTCTALAGPAAEKR